MSVEYVTDPVAIAEAGIMATPALLVNGKVVSQGKVLAQSEIRSSCRRKPLSDGVRSALDSRNILIEYIDKHQFLRFGIMETEKTALLFKALGDENRLRILKLVSQGEDLCACRILDELDITQPTLSHHMKILKDAGLISARKQGRWMHYSISENAINKGVECLQRFRTE